MKSIVTGIIALAAAQLLTNCSSTPTFGEMLKAEGAGVESIGQKWEKGHKMVKKGEDLVEDGESAQKRGKKMVSKGTELQSEGNRLMQEATAEYNARKAQANAVVVPTVTAPQ